MAEVNYVSKSCKLYNTCLIHLTYKQIGHNEGRIDSVVVELSGWNIREDKLMANQDV